MDALTSNFYDRYAANLSAVSEASRSALLPSIESALARGASVLDVGAGSGRDLAAMLELGLNAYGVEPNQAMREKALLTHPALHGRLCEGMLPELGRPFSERCPNGFDAVVCSAVLMHLGAAHLPHALEALVAQLRPSAARDADNERPALLISVPEMDQAQLAEGRDMDGRRFHNHALDEIQNLLALQGLSLERASASDAVLASAGTRWHTLVFRRIECRQAAGAA